MKNKPEESKRILVCLLGICAGLFEAIGDFIDLFRPWAFNENYARVPNIFSRLSVGCLSKSMAIMFDLKD